VIELLSGNDVTNTNRSFHMDRIRFYVCPICGNLLYSAGDAVVCCCGVRLPPLEAESPDEGHAVSLQEVEDELYVSFAHAMSKQHFISFLAAVSDDGCELVKLYPEGSAAARIKRRRAKWLYYYCNRHGLFRTRIV